MRRNFSRRNFIKKTLLTGSFVCFPSIQILQPDKSRILIARSQSVRNANASLDSTAVSDLLKSAMENYFSSTRPWKLLFKPEDRVGIKVNCLAGKGISTSVELVDAIVENLLSADIRRENIIIWDRSNSDLEKAGYQIQTSSRAVKCYGNDHSGYTEDLYESLSIGSFLSNILVRQCTAVINVPVLKDHGIVGVTNALKNFFGAIHNPNKYHSHVGDPFIADVNLLPEIRHKVRLTICDALTAQYEGGPPFMPQWAWPCNSILIGTDMVAMDTVAWDIIERKRAEKGFPSLKAVGREPGYIRTAADADHRLGTNDRSKIDKIELT